MATSKKAQTKPQVKEEVVVEEVRPIVPKDIDVNEYIPVRNGFHGILVYTSSRTGETFIWDNFGDEQDIELRELKNAKNSNKAFFQNNWFMFDDEYAWVINYLGVGQFYKHSVGIDNFDDIFALPPDELKDRLGEMSEGQKTSVMYRAAELIRDGGIDSRKTIQALEDALGIELIEK